MLKIKKMDTPEFTVDIEVENTHSYQLENGWVSHNTVSQLTDAASGIHPRHDHYYIRRVKTDNKDPLTQFMILSDFPYEKDIKTPDTNSIFTFPIKAPEGTTTRNELTTIDHLNTCLMYQKYWCEHKPSVTINIKEEEWPMVGSWVWKNFDEISGMAFLPYDGGSYIQAPYETIDKEQYEELLKKIPTDIDWNLLIEEEDNVEGVQTLACSSGSCELP